MGGGGGEGQIKENRFATKIGKKLRCKIGTTTKLNAEIYYKCKRTTKADTQR